ncbi:MAG: hypothetical protein ACFFAS_18605 [Promethearchaeota archaeon]
MKFAPKDGEERSKGCESLRFGKCFVMVTGAIYTVTTILQLRIRNKKYRLSDLFFSFKSTDLKRKYRLANLISLAW